MPILKKVDRRENRWYCPYCNRHNVRDLTDEHVIPRSVGGTDDTVILVCKPCNDRAGSAVDPLLTSFSMIKALTASRYGHMMSRHERHTSAAVLKDGRKLNGYFYTEMRTPTSWGIAFEPLRHQDDGSIWINAASLKNGCVPPTT